MFTQQGPGGVFYSAIEKEPDMHPLIEMGASLTPYVAGGYALKHLASTPYSYGSEYSKIDILQKKIRNFADRTPYGMMNTFRFSEYLSPHMSAAGLGLEKSDSLLDPSKKVGRYVFEAKYLSNESTRKTLEALLGKNEFDKVSTHFTKGNDLYQLVYEQDLEGRGSGKLFFQQLEEFVDESDNQINVKKRAIESSTKLLSEKVRLQEQVYSASIYDHLEGIGKTKKINPAYLGFLQSLNLDKNVDYTEVFAASKNDKAKYGLVHDIDLNFKGIENLHKSLALLTAPLSMGMNRFNRLLTSTKEQIPFAGEFIAKAADATGLSLKTRPEVFYKQFGKLGLQASKIGAAYLGLKTIDHYRREFGTIGNVVASAGIGFGVEALYQKISTEKKLGSGKAGMIAFATQVLAPGFNQGIVEGFATTLKNIDIGRSYIGEVTGLSAVRRTIEGMLPGFTDYTTGLALGVGTAALSYSGYGRGLLKRTIDGEESAIDSILKKIVPQSIKDEIGFIGNVEVPGSNKAIAAETVLDILVPKVDTQGNYTESFVKYNPFAQQIMEADPQSAVVKAYDKRLAKILDGKSIEDLSKSQVNQLHAFFSDADEITEHFIGKMDHGASQVLGDDFDFASRQIVKGNIYQQDNINNALNKSLLNRIQFINYEHAEGGFVNAVKRRAKIFGAEIYHSFMGANMSGEFTRMEGDKEITESYDDIAKKLDASPIFRRFGMLTVGVAAIHQLLTTGIFGSLEKPEELKNIYSGNKMVAVKAGRFWEGGGTPYEGNETRYFRPHQYAMLMSQAKEKSVWGDDVERLNPISRFFLKNFTYYLEEKNYYDRPYPMTGGAFSDVPVIGSLLETTLGRFIKPRKLMHQNELMKVNPETGLVERAYLEEYGSSVELGQEPPGMPTSPDNLLTRMGEVQYQFREIEGMTGYAKNYLQKMFTGRETLGTKEFQIASANDIDSMVLDFWDMDLGGMAFTSEAIRRLLPRPRGDIEKYNPVSNTMPYYIPERFKRGDPYRLLPNGFARLPGEGYEAIYPELKGVDPEDYPDIHKYKILADIAPQSRNTMKLRNLLMERRAAGITTEYENIMMDEAIKVHQKTLGKIDPLETHPNAIKIPLISDLVSTAYSTGENIVRKISAPIEYLIPGGFRPAQKLLGKTRSSIETYEQERLYGTTNAFWDKHWRDWFRPAMLSGANLMGWEGKPAYVQKREELDKRFDKINFYKYMMLASGAENVKDKNRYLGLASRTRTGVNPMGDSLGLYLSLPQAEKKFFESFSQAEGDERKRILEMVPEDQQKIYRAVWSRVDSGERIDLSFAQNKALIDEVYLNQQMQETEAYLEEVGMPKADWVGWHKDVDISDIKIKYLKNLGAEYADHDVWESQVRRLSRRPYLEGSDKFFFENPTYSRSDQRLFLLNKIREQSGEANSNYLINEFNTPFMKSRSEVTYNDDRFSEIQALTLANVRG